MNKSKLLLVVATLLMGHVGVLNAAWTYGTNYSQNDYDNSATTITKEGETSWNNGSGTEQGVRLGGSSTSILAAPAYNWDDKYVIIQLEGNVPGTLSFSYRTNSSSATSADWYVAESSDGSNWTNIWSTTRNSSSSADATANISKGTRYLKLCYSGNFSGYYFHPQITPSRSLSEPSASTLDFGDDKLNTTATKSFTIDWCAVPALSYSVTGTNADNVSVSISNNAQETTYGTATVSVDYSRATVGTLNANLVISAGSYGSKTIALTGSTGKYDQTVIWSDSLAAAINDTLQNIASAELDLTYASSDPSVISIVDGKFIATGAGTAIITASNEGSDIYNAASSTHEIVVKARVLLSAAGGVGDTVLYLNLGDSMPAGIAAPTYEHYIFQGYYDYMDDCYYNADMTSNMTWNNNYNDTLTARWTPIQYTITYIDSLNAENPNPTTYTCEDSIQLDTINYEGYTFLGWFNENGDTVTVIAKGTTGDITLTAGWEKKEEPASALAETSAQQKTTKFFHNGQLYIRKNDQLYNLKGHLIK